MIFRGAAPLLVLALGACGSDEHRRTIEAQMAQEANGMAAADTDAAAGTGDAANALELPALPDPAQQAFNAEELRPSPPTGR